MATISEALAIALEAHQAGKLQNAADIYQQILTHEPCHADALHLLGVVSHQTGQMDEASALIQKAIASNQNTPVFYNSLGNLRCDQKRYDEAIEAFQTAIRLNPDAEDPYLNLGSAYYESGRFEEAVETFQKVLHLNPNAADVHNNLANAYKDLEQVDEAIEHYKQAIALEPGYVEAHFNLGNLYRDQEDFDQAIESYQNALRLNPDFAASYVNLGLIYSRQSDYTEAITSYQKALSLDPNLTEVHVNLGSAYAGLGKLDESVACFKTAITLNPDAPKGYLGLGNTYFKFGKMGEAAVAFEQAVALDPEYAEGYFILGNIHFYQDKIDKAIHYYEKALAVQPDFQEALSLIAVALNRINGAKQARKYLDRLLELEPSDGNRLKWIMSLQHVYQTHEEMDQWRDEFETALRDLLPNGISVEDPIREVGSTNFYLAYHGRNDTAIQRDFAALFRNVPTWDAIQTRKNAKPRIGIISRLFRHKHTITKLVQGFVDHLSRDKFEVVVFLIEDPFTQRAHIHIPDTDTTVWLPDGDLQKACEQVGEQNLDVLFYADIGMDPVTFYMAFSRLAPVQCTTWGHPVTTGIPTVDYYLSSKALEPDGAQAYYTEKLVEFDHLPTYYYWPKLEGPPKTRADFGLSEEDHLYVCSQSLFKLHPDFDEVLAGILRKDPKAKAVFLHFRYKVFGEALMQRWRRVMPDVADRIQILNRLNDNEFLNLQALADVLLDPLHFGAGSTSLEALAFGTPLVTLPPEFMRGRIALGCYKLMGVMDCVASTPEEYVDIAVRLGTDPAYRQAVKAKIEANNQVLFENPRCIQELEQFFLDAVETARSKESHLETIPKEGHCV